MQSGSDKIVFTVPGYKILKELQNEIQEENEIESKYQKSEQKSFRKDQKSKMNTLNSQKLIHPTLIFSDLASPTNNLYNSMKDNLNITSILLKPRTATALPSERLKVLTTNSNFSTTNNFFTNKQSSPQAQNLDATTLSRIAIRNSKKAKIPINVNETRLAMIPAGHSRLPSVIIDAEKSKTECFGNNSQKHELLRLRHDEAKLEKIIASNEQKQRQFSEVGELLKKKMEERRDRNKEYFNKKDPFWRSFFDSNRLIEQFEVINHNFDRRMNERIQGYMEDKYKKQWCKIHVGKNKPQKSPLIFGREDLRKFEQVFLKVRKNVKSADEPLVPVKEKEELKRSKTNLSKVSLDQE